MPWPTMPEQKPEQAQVKEDENDALKKVVDNLSERAETIINDCHKQIDVMQSAFADFKSLGSISGLMSIMNSGTLNGQQVELAQRLAVKVIAILGMIEATKKRSLTAP